MAHSHVYISPSFLSGKHIEAYSLSPLSTPLLILSHIHAYFAVFFSASSCSTCVGLLSKFFSDSLLWSAGWSSL